VIGIDTNLLVRYLTKDHESQWEKATQILQSGKTCFLTNIVLCKLPHPIAKQFGWGFQQPWKFHNRESPSLQVGLQSNPIF